MLYLHATLDTSNAYWRLLQGGRLGGEVFERDTGELANRLSMGCEVLMRMRNSSVNVEQLDSTVNAVLMVLRCRGDGAPVNLSALEQGVCLLHTVCWCSVDSPEPNASYHSGGRGVRKCLALEHEAFAQRLADQCAELVCALLIDEHARSKVLALHACGALMMMYKFCPQTQGRLVAATAATAVLEAYAYRPHRADADGEGDTHTEGGKSKHKDSARAKCDCGVVSNACALLWVVLNGEQVADARLTLAGAVCPAVEVLWGQLEMLASVEGQALVLQGAGAHERKEREQAVVQVTEAAWRVLSLISQPELSPHGWGGEAERQDFAKKTVPYGDIYHEKSLCTDFPECVLKTQSSPTRHARAGAVPGCGRRG